MSKVRNPVITNMDSTIKASWAPGIKRPFSFTFMMIQNSAGTIPKRRACEGSGPNSEDMTTRISK